MTRKIDENTGDRDAVASTPPFRFIIGLALAAVVSSTLVGCGGGAVEESDDSTPAGGGGGLANAFGVAPEQASGKSFAGKTTQEVIDARQAVADGATVLADGPNMRSYIGKAYGTVYDTAIISIDRVLMQYEIINGRYPKDHNEFMNQVLKLEGIRLPSLPRENAYGYDPDSHSLVILELPAGAEVAPEEQPEPAEEAPKAEPFQGLPGLPGGNAPN